MKESTKVLVKDIFKDSTVYEGKSIQLNGWVRTLRDNKNFAFIELNDGSYFKSIQIVLDNTLNNYNEIIKINVGASLNIVGELVPSVGEKQAFEIKAIEIEVEGLSSADYPMQKKRHTYEYLRTQLHLRPRTNTFSAVFRIRSIASFALHKFFNERNFVYAHTPILTGSDCEGAGEMFQVTTLDLKNVSKTKEGEVDFSEDFFGKMAALTVSGQLYAETFAMAFRDVYTFGPTFRAENSNTGRHAAEFWMLEPEIAFADLNDNMKLVEDMLKYCIKYIMDNAAPEIEFFNNFVDKTLIERLECILNSDFEKVTYTDAVEMLIKSGQKFEYEVKWGIDLQTEHEKYLTEQIYKKPVFVTDYPKDIKAFYMRMNDDNKTVAAMDLLVPGVGELVGGSQREERLEHLEKRMDEMGIVKEDYWWYLELRKFGGTKHAGFGLGFERLIMYVTGMTNIRDVVAFPRTVNNADF